MLEARIAWYDRENKRQPALLQTDENLLSSWKWYFWGSDDKMVEKRIRKTNLIELN